MDEPPSSILGLILLLFGLSSFFSGSEAALLSIGSAKVRSLKKKHKTGSTALEYLKNHPKKLIITILIGTNIVNILIPVLTTIWATNKFGDNIIAIVTGFLTIILLVFGEIIPKNMGQIYSERVALFSAPVIFWMLKIIYPLVWIFEAISDLIISKKGHDSVTEDEVLAMVSLGAEGGAIEEEERELIENVLEFTDTTAEEVMTPRTNLEIMHENTTLGDAVEFFIQNSHSRIPVFSGDVDNIIGVITLKQALKSWKQYEDSKLIKNLDLKAPIFVPTTKKIADIFRMLQRERMHIAIVVDEHGGTAGILTMEDILEEVFGEITDESDVDQLFVKKISEKAWSVPGQFTLWQIKEHTGISLEEGDDLESENKPLALFILEQLEDIPDRGDIVETPLADLVIERMDGRKIGQVRIQKK